MNIVDELKNIFIYPLKRHISSVLFYGGLVLVFIGAIFGDAIDAFNLVPNGTGEAILKSGSAILGAGVFAVIMKSAQFIELFQKNIFDVFSDPKRVVGKDGLSEKWRYVTRAILKDLLPASYVAAAEYIEKKYFDDELEYHFENIVAEYEIDVVDGVAKVRCTTKGNIIISPCSKNPVLEHVLDLESGNNFKLEMLLINGQAIEVDGLYIVDENNPSRRVMNFSLAQYARKISGGDDRVVNMCRTVSWEQQLAMEPYVKFDVKRYVKGYVAEVKSSGLSTVKLEPFEMRRTGSLVPISTPQGYKRWTIASEDELLLPGQGFIIFLVQ